MYGADMNLAVLQEFRIIAEVSTIHNLLDAKNAAFSTYLLYSWYVLGT